MKRILLGTLVFCGIGYFFYDSLTDAVNNCGELEAVTRSAILAAKSCRVDQDCLLLGLPCPYECLNPIRGDAKPQVLSALNDYNKNCLAMCPDCPKDSSSKVACKNQQCTLIR